jgi:orotidine 5'-phosphate decarboxylase subfamily 1
VSELVVALDMATAEDALALLDRLPRARWVKVGSILFTREGPALLDQLRRRGLSIFLDLKWHDIPNTVAGAVAAARDAGVAMATVHTLGGVEMMRALGMTPEQMQAQSVNFLARIPLHRQGVPDDIARVTLFLASGLADYITGESIVVDGGYLLS